MSDLFEHPIGMLESMSGAEAEYARRVRRGGYATILTHALNARSVSARGIFARAASDGTFGLLELEALLSASRAGPDRVATDLIGSMSVKPLLAMAALLGNQRLRETDTADAIQLYGLIHRAFGSKPFGREDRMLYLELLSEARLEEEYVSAVEAMPLASGDWRQIALMSANLVNPWRDRALGDVTRWNTYLEDIFCDARLEPPSVLPTAVTPFDNILCSSLEGVADGPMITVIVPTHNPGRRLSTALGSLVNQTWANLEILVLDDGSDALHRRYMDAWAERDARVRLIRIRSNVGNYAVRNVGLREADGVFVTVHDDDDWSHPRKLELQARHLLDSSGSVANMSQLVRTSESLIFTRINNNPNFIQPNYSSLMFRREPVVASIGYWDEVNRAGDAEYRNRMAVWWGSPPAVVPGPPLSFLRVRDDSLTAGEIHRGYVDSRRRWYEMAGTVWHRGAAANGESLYLHPGRGREKFSAPTSMGRGSKEMQNLDVLYATDFRFPGGNNSVSASEIGALLDGGYRVGLIQIDSPVLGPANSLTEQICQLALHANCQVFGLNDAVTAELLLLRHPTVMQYAAPSRRAASAARGVLIVNHAPRMRDGSASHYDIDVCVENFTAMFGFPPLVAPESGVIRAALGSSVSMYAEDWNGILPSAVGRARQRRSLRPPVIGRHSRDSVEKWPTSAEDLAAAYPLDASRDIRVLGGAEAALSRFSPRLPCGWTVYPFGSMDPAQFLQEIDFWVYFHAEDLIESFGMATVEAMASGAVVVLPHYMEPTFGNGALYCKPGDVQGVIDELWQDPTKYAEQSRRGVAVAAERFTADAFLARVKRLMLRHHPPG